ncbi:hypothetical protein CAPTEDRAFT_207691 [Capitella teleta]|uniref:Tetraspanin n=1 Tax=Capitella teleta TaxID=283909 RepID=R7V3K7_CAPTE|nr:hypothetical protein CAPTEDRAFT_207691 [Capitella teleta]|eukprot:ELU13433.1 hypothetical protein CAPTEDRAFT_207691 [Capitella teleta]
MPAMRHKACSLSPDAGWVEPEIVAVKSHSQGICHGKVPTYCETNDERRADAMHSRAIIDITTDAGSLRTLTKEANRRIILLQTVQHRNTQRRHELRVVRGLRHACDNCGQRGLPGVSLDQLDPRVHEVLTDGPPEGASENHIHLIQEEIEGLFQHFNNLDTALLVIFHVYLFFGMFGFCSRKIAMPLLGVYVIILSGLMVVQAVTIGLLTTGKLDELLKTHLTDALVDNYKGNFDLGIESLSMNTLQSQYGCCGVNDWMDYVDASHWNRAEGFKIRDKYQDRRSKVLRWPVALLVSESLCMLLGIYLLLAWRYIKEDEEEGDEED